jgi:hypothetical protein
MDICARIHNFVEIYTISDLSHNIGQVMRYPVNLFLTGIENSKVYRFFEFDCQTGTGFISIMISVYIWYYGILTIAEFIEKQFFSKK